MFSKSIRGALIALAALAVSISASQSLSVKVTGTFEFYVSIHIIWMFNYRSYRSGRCRECGTPQSRGYDYEHRR